MMNRTRTTQDPSSRHDVVAQRTSGRRHKRMALTLAGIATLILGAASVASAGQDQTVSYQVSPTRSISIGNFTSVSFGTIGKSTTKTESGGTLSYSTDNSAPDKITVGMNSDTAAGVTLKVSAGAIGSCTGGNDTKGIPGTAVNISTATTNDDPQDLITGIEAPTGSDCTSALTYSLQTSGAAFNASEVSKTVTYTIQAA